MDRDFSPSYATSTHDEPAARTIVRLARPAHATVENAVARHGRAEHEWLQPAVGSGSAFNRHEARMFVDAKRCIASTDDQALDVELVIYSGSANAVAEILYQLPDNSYLCADDAWDLPIFDAIADDTERRIRVALPDGRTKIICRLECGGRFSVRLVNQKS
jgi:hypothetical protein